MTVPWPLPMLESAEELARCGCWTREVYSDLIAFQAGRLGRAELDAKYRYRTAILTLDITGFTVGCFEGGEPEAFLRILDVQKICVPALREHGASLVRAFADDLVALFGDAGRALDAALEMHRRVALFNARGRQPGSGAECCIGIGYGDVYAIGPNLAMGDEMNRSSKLGEETARGSETLVTENVFHALRARADVAFRRIVKDDMPFPYYRVTAVASQDA